MYDDDGYFAASPGVRRAVHEAAAALQAQGVEIVPWTPPDVPLGMTLFVALLGADGGKHQQGQFAGDKPTPQLAALFQASNLPRNRCVLWLSA